MPTADASPEFFKVKRFAGTTRFPAHTVSIVRAGGGSAATTLQQSLLGEVKKPHRHSIVRGKGKVLGLCHQCRYLHLQVSPGGADVTTETRPVYFNDWSDTADIIGDEQHTA